MLDFAQGTVYPMSSDIDQPRQRTVAELLAEHGGGVPTGRRRRRRADEAATAVGSDPAAPAAAAPAGAAPAEAAPSAGPTTAVEDEKKKERPAPAAPAVGAASVWDAPPAVPAVPAAPAESGTSAGSDTPAAEAGEPAAPVEPRPTSGAAPAAVRAGEEQPADWPTEQIPLVGGSCARDVDTRDTGNGPIDRLRRASPKWRDALQAVERSERELRNGHGNGRAPTRPPAAGDEFDDGGPPTQAAPLDPDFRAPAGLDPTDFERPDSDPAEPDGRYPGRPDERPPADDQADDRPLEADDGEERGGTGRARRPKRPAARRAAANRSGASLAGADWVGPDAVRAGQAVREQAAREEEPVEDGPDLEPRRRLGRAAAEAPVGPGWTVVLAQWIGGALGGAALWIGFRFLWRSLPVVAFAASVLITIGLVLLVRALLRNEGRRTTVFVVLVGLLLTVSPAILVLLDR